MVRLLYRVFVLTCVIATSAPARAQIGASGAAPQEGATLQLFTAPDEDSAPSEWARKEEIVSAVAQALGSGGTQWYLVKTKAGAMGWIKAGETDATKTFERSFQSLRTEPSATLTDRPSAGTRARSAITVPLDVQGSLAVVAVTFNRRLTANLALDTGATKTMISRRIANQLALHSSGSGLFSGIGGTVAASFSRIESVRVGEAEVSNLVVAIHDFSRTPKYEGLLGLDFLGKFSIALDTNKQLLTLTPR